MYTTEIDSGLTAWPTQIDAVLWTERKLNNFLALVVYQNLFSVYSTRFFPNVLASTLRFESRQQSTVLVVERREPRFACVRCARRRSVDQRCLHDFCSERESASYCRMRRLPSSFSKFVLGSRGWCWDKTWRTLSTVNRRPTTGRWCVRALSINYTVLASGHWRTTPAGDLFIAEIPRFAVVERQKYFRFSLPWTTPTQTLRPGKKQ